MQEAHAVDCGKEVYTLPMDSGAMRPKALQSKEELL
jgi:hypothetical protein